MDGSIDLHVVGATYPQRDTVLTASSSCKRPFLTRRSVGGSSGLPIPGQKFVEAGYRMSSGHPVENVFQIGIGFDAIEFGGRDKRGHDGPPIGAAVRVGKRWFLRPIG